jgi:CubicO group peptidase (beta-lactamase class C family)
MPDWELMSLSDAGFDSAFQQRLNDAIAEKRVWNVHALLVARGGKLVFERYFEGKDDLRGLPLGVVGFTPGTLHDLRSVTKSIVGLLYGIALSRGQVPEPDQPLLAQFPEYADLAGEAYRQKLTVAHVLTMTLGTEWNEDIPYTSVANSEIAMDLAEDPFRFVLERPYVGTPGERWIYNGGATALLGRLIARGTGQSLPEFAHAALFEPLSLGQTTWLRTRRGEISAASGLRMTPRDLLRIGQMMLDGGKAAGRTIVPSDWLTAALGPKVTIDEARQYGYHWYLGRLPYPEATSARTTAWAGAAGNGGQRLIVLPEQEIAIAITAGNYDTPEQSVPPTRLLREVVLASLRLARHSL